MLSLVDIFSLLPIIELGNTWFKVSSQIFKKPNNCSISSQVLICIVPQTRPMQLHTYFEHIENKKYICINEMCLLVYNLYNKLTYILVTFLMHFTHDWQNFQLHHFKMPAVREHTIAKYNTSCMKIRSGTQCNTLTTFLKFMFQSITPHFNGYPYTLCVLSNFSFHFTTWPIFRSSMWINHFWLLLPRVVLPHWLGDTRMRKLICGKPSDHKTSLWEYIFFRLFIRTYSSISYFAKLRFAWLWGA